MPASIFDGLRRPEFAKRRNDDAKTPPCQARSNKSRANEHSNMVDHEELSKEPIAAGATENPERREKEP